MLKDKVLKIAELHKEIRNLLDEASNETTTKHGVYWCLDSSFAWGEKQDVCETAKALGVFAVTADRNCYEYPTETYFMVDGIKFYTLNSKEESEVVK